MAADGERVFLQRQLHDTAIDRRHGLRLDLLANMFLQNVEVPRLLLAVDDQHPVRVVLHIAVELGPELDPEVVGGLLHVRPRQAEYGNPLGDAKHHRLCHFVIAAHHAVEHAVRLDVVELHPFSLQEPPQRSHLVDGDRRQFLGGELHLAAPESLQIGQPGVRADFNVMRFAVPDRLHHDQRITAVEATGDVGDIDHGKQLEVGTACPVAVL